MTLEQLKVGQQAEIEDISAANGLRRRLMELGLTPSATVSVIRVAPMGDPMEISVRGYRLSLRKLDASLIQCRQR